MIKESLFAAEEREAKLKKDGGHAGHNGLRDIIAHLNSNQFYRLRIGIGRPAAGKVVADFVLLPPPKSEFELLLTAFDLSRSYIPQMVNGDMAAVMNLLNSAKK
jgi:peptidyl-tRNA hydrolase, PTH1 family